MNKRLLLVLWVAVLVLFSACQPAALENENHNEVTQAVETQPQTKITPIETVDIVPVDTPDSTKPTIENEGIDSLALAAAKQTLSERLGISTDDIAVKFIEENQWSDGCLGAAQPDEMCTQALVAGYRIVLVAEGHEYEFHTNLDGSQVREFEKVVPKGQLGQVKVVRNALKFLADHLGVPEKQVTMLSIRAVQWPDSCLGVDIKDSVCAQVITPGYLINFIVDGKQYEVHSDNDGEAIIIAGEVASNANEDELIWEFVDDNGTCYQVEIRSSQAEYGDCKSDLLPLSINKARLQEYDALLKTFSSFDADTAVGSVLFQGAGQQKATESEQRSIAEWANVMFNEAATAQNDPDLGVALKWSRQGGLVGFCDDLVIYKSGWAYAMSCKAQLGEAPRMSRLTSDQLDQLYFWMDQYSNYENKPADIKGADVLEIKLDFWGTGSQKVTTAVLEEMKDLAEQVFNSF